MRGQGSGDSVACSESQGSYAAELGPEFGAAGLRVHARAYGRWIGQRRLQVLQPHTQE